MELRQRFLWTGAACAAVMLAGCQSRSKLCSIELMAGRFTLTSTPEHAKVYQIWPVTYQRILLGETPMENFQVMVPKSVKMEKVTPAEMANVMSQMGKVKLMVTKEGYEQRQLLLDVGKTESIAHKITLTKTSETSPEAR